MNGQENDGWFEECRRFGIDPDEVETVARHYRAYRQYTEAAKGDPLPLDQWFKWYHIEKASENQNLGVAPAGCSVDSQSQGNSLISQPDVFLELLKTCVTRLQF